MVKDSKVKKPAKAVTEAEMPRRAQKGFVATGRPPGDPLDIRSERLVLRVHPDLLETLTDCAAAARMTRSLYVEQILLVYLNRVENAELDSIGRKIEDAEIRHPEKTAPKDAGDGWTAPRPASGLARLRAGISPPPTRAKKR
jgi:hypothetical protein